MFYDSYFMKYRNGEVTKFGSLNAMRYHQKVCNVLHALRPKGQVLEIGPGVGMFAEQCSLKGYSYVGVEFNWRSSQELATHFQMIRSLVPPFPIKNESVDIIVADQVVEHMPTFREAQTLLFECWRSLTVSGLLVIGFPDAMRIGWSFYDGDYSHSFLTTENRMIQILTDTGFMPLRVMRFTGSISNPMMRFLLDLFNFLVNGRMIFFLVSTIGGKKLLYKMRKTLAASTIILAQKRT